MQTVNTGIIKIFLVARITSDCTRHGHAGPITIKHNTKLLGAERISITHCSTLYRLSILAAAPMCQLHAADCLILILNDICSVVSGAASCHYGVPMWPRFGPNKSHPLKLSTLIWCKQSDWQSKHALLFKHKHKQAHSWHMFYSWQWIVTQSYFETFATKSWIVLGWNWRRDIT